MRAVNLLPEELRPGARWASVGRGASARHVLGGSGIAAGVLALAFTGLLMHERGVVDDRRSALHDVETRLVAAQAQAAEVQATQAATAARLAAMRTVVSQRIAWEDVLRDLSRVLPRGIVLQSLDRDIAHADCGAWRSARRRAGRRDAHWLHGHRLRRLAGQGRARPRPARPASVALGRDAPVERSRIGARGTRPCNSRSEQTSAPQEVDDDRAPQRTRSGRNRRGRPPARRARRLVRCRRAAAVQGGRALDSRSRRRRSSSRSPRHSSTVRLSA